MMAFFVIPPVSSAPGRRAWRALLSLPLVLAGSVTSLTGLEGAPPANSAVHQPSSDTVIKWVGAPRYSGVATLVADLTIGGINSPAETEFTNVSKILMAKNGSVFIMDLVTPNSAILRQYDAKGKYIRTVGRAGKGPGEFSRSGGMAQLPDGRILVRDLGSSRINIYSDKGESIGTWQMAGYPGLLENSATVLADRAGTIYVLFAFPGQPLAQRVLDPRAAILRLTPDGTVIDTVLVPPLPDVSVTILLHGPTTGRISSATTIIPVPYSPAAMWAWSPEGYLLTGVTTRYAFEMFEPRQPATVSRTGAGAPWQGPPALWKAGDRITSVRRAVATVPISVDERAERTAELQRKLRGRPADARNGTEIPRSKPAYTDLQVGDDGRIWVRVSTPSERHGSAWREPALYDVYEPDATYIGQVTVPFGTQLKTMRGDTVWGVVRNEDAVPTPTRFRIKWP